MPASDNTKESDGLLPAPAAQPELAPASRRTRPIYRVFVSSTWIDLQPERSALMEALNRMEEMRFVGMEFFGNRPDDTHDASIDQVDLCEVFVGIIGYRYGSGITEAEYRRARELGLPCFVYFKREADLRPGLTDGDPVRAAKLAAFKQDLLRGHTVKEFASPAELAANATADLHNWVAARWISLERGAPIDSRVPVAPPPDADRTNILRLLERIQHDWIEGVLEASLHHRAWLELGLDWKEDAVEHPWDRIVVAPNRPIQTLRAEDSITGVFDAAQNTLLVLGEPGAGKTTTLLELARELIQRARQSPPEPAPVVLALSTWTGVQRDLSDWIVAELGARYQVPKRLARAWLDDARLVLLLDGLDEVPSERRAACVEAINAFEEAHHPPGLAVTCRVAEYDALTVKLRLRAAICLQALTPAQVDRYFAAAGAGLEQLRQAMCDDAVLRELARTPLMLSVMTMAWRGVPSAAAISNASKMTGEEARRHLFDAYVQAALNRHGKSVGRYAPGDTMRWLAWTARRMRAHGQTLFALEQLQPTWLDGARSQFGYFASTRLLGTIGLAVPSFWMIGKTPLADRWPCALLSVFVGLVFGGIDFLLVRRASHVGDLGSRRFWVMLAAIFGISIAWVAVMVATHPEPGPTISIGMTYLAMAAFAFCSAADVRRLDIKPAESMGWSWRLALERFWVGVVGLNLIVFIMGGIATAAQIHELGWSAAIHRMGGGWYLCGLAGGAAAGIFGSMRVWHKSRVFGSAVFLALIAIGGQVGSLAGGWESTGFLAMIVIFAVAGFIGIFGGFVSGMVDSSRARRAGVWFWLRVPLLAMVVVGLLMTIPGVVWVLAESARGAHSSPGRALLGVLVFGAGCGLVGFFRFGGFNGLQHGVLRWLLVRSGELPPKAEAFFDYAARVALLQKVGSGYRFIHALLLDHLAAKEVKPTK